MMIHWLGFGLSSYAGIKQLKDPFTIWVRNTADAKEKLAKLGRTDVLIEKYDEQALEAAVQKGDVVVSMFPAPMHPPIAAMCVRKKAHLVTSSYISPQMRELEAQAKANGSILLNEVGLDPGLDHLFAHELFARHAKALSEPGVTYKFQSLCGGMPAIPENSAIKYQFSWAPAGVLKALKNQSKWIENGAVQNTSSPASEMRTITCAEIGNEQFEMYPNRDSTAYVQEYASDCPAKPTEFIRGTLRPLGWKKSWAEIFTFLDTNPAAEEIEAYSKNLQQKYFYAEGESDRVVMVVTLKAVDAKGVEVVNDQISFSITGKAPFNTAMSQLVSLPVLVAVSEVKEGYVPAGVQALQSDADARARWFKKLASLQLNFKK